MFPSLSNQCGGTIHFYLLSEKNKQTKLKRRLHGLMVLFWSPNKVQKAYEVDFRH